MAGLSRKGDAYYGAFRFGGRRYHFTAGRPTEAQARAKAAEVDETLALIERGRLQAPDGVPRNGLAAAGGTLPPAAPGRKPAPPARPSTTTSRRTPTAPPGRTRSAPPART